MGQPPRVPAIVPTQHCDAEYREALRGSPSALCGIVPAAGKVRELAARRVTPLTLIRLVAAGYTTNA